MTTLRTTHEHIFYTTVFDISYRLHLKLMLAKIFCLVLTLKIFLHNQRTQSYENSQGKHIVKLRDRTCSFGGLFFRLNMLSAGSV